MALPRTPPAATGVALAARRKKCRLRSRIISLQLLCPVHHDIHLLRSLQDSQSTRGSYHVSCCCQTPPTPDAHRTRPQLVKNSQIKSSSLHNPLPLYLHTYIWPFLAAWPAFLAIYLSEERYTKYINGAEWTFVWAGSIFSLQALTWLTTKWNVNISAFFTSTSTNDVQSAQLIKIVPVTNAGAAEICPLIRDRVRSA